MTRRASHQASPANSHHNKRMKWGPLVRFQQNLPDLPHHPLLITVEQPRHCCSSPLAGAYFTHKTAETSFSTLVDALMCHITLIKPLFFWGLLKKTSELHCYPSNYITSFRNEWHYFVVNLLHWKKFTRCPMWKQMQFNVHLPFSWRLYIQPLIYLLNKKVA